MEVVHFGPINQVQLFHSSLSLATREFSGFTGSQTSLSGLCTSQHVWTMIVVIRSGVEGWRHCPKVSSLLISDLFSSRQSIKFDTAIILPCTSVFSLRPVYMG